MAGAVRIELTSVILETTVLTFERHPSVYELVLLVADDSAILKNWLISSTHSKQLLLLKMPV